jgi:hypothetical protein
VFVGELEITVGCGIWKVESRVGQNLSEDTLPSFVTAGRGSSLESFDGCYGS